MSEPTRVTALLAATAGRVQPGAAPVDTIRRRVRRGRRGRALAATAAVALVVVGVVVLPGLLEPPTAPEQLVTVPEPQPEPAGPAPVSPSLDQLRPQGPPADRVVDVGPVAEVYLDSVGGARTDPVDPSLLVLTIPAGNGLDELGEPCWGGATARAVAGDDVVQLDLIRLSNAQPPVLPAPEPNPGFACRSSLGFVEVTVDLGAPLAGRSVVIPGGRELEVADGSLLPVATLLSSGWSFLGAGAGRVRHRPSLDGGVAADLHAAGLPFSPGGLSGHPGIERFEVAPGREAVVSQYAPLGSTSPGPTSAGCWPPTSPACRWSTSARSCAAWCGQGTPTRPGAEATSRRSRSRHHARYRCGVPPRSGRPRGSRADACPPLS